jgi:hypothetical protein
VSHLADIQAGFHAYLVGDKKGASFVNQIVNDEKVGAEKRLGIYYDAYRLRIIEVLSNVYPNLKRLLGDAYFDQAARRYIDAYPSTYRNMRWVGDQMSLHLEQTLPEHPIAAEMATFEWALGLAFDAEDAPVLQLQDLTIVPPEEWSQLIFTFHPSMQILAFNWNVVEVWQALDSECSPPVAILLNGHCLVWRHMTNSYFRMLDDAELYAIQLVMNGGSFGEMCELLQQNNVDEQSAMNQAAQYLSQWINEELLSSFNQPTKHLTVLLT